MTRKVKKHSVYQSELKCGARVLLIDIPQSSDFHVSVNFRSGTRFFEPEMHQVPHLLEHMVFEGTEKYPDHKAFLKEVESIKADCNASTNPDFNSYYLTGKSGHATKLIELAIELSFKSTLPDKRLAEEKSVIEHELSEYAQSTGFLGDYINKATIFPKLYPDFDQVMKSLQEITVQDLKNARGKFYVPNNAFIVVAGKLPQSRRPNVLKLIATLLGGLPGGKRQILKKIKMETKGRFINRVSTPKSDRGAFDIYFFREKNDTYLPPLRVFEALCSGNSEKSIEMKLRDSGLVYELEADSGLTLDATSFSFSGTTKRDSLSSVIDLIFSELSNALSDQLTEQEVSQACEWVIDMTKADLQDTLSLVEWYEPAFVDEEALQSPNDWIAKINKVTTADILNLKKTLINPSRMALTLFGHRIHWFWRRYEKIIDRAF